MLQIPKTLLFIILTIFVAGIINPATALAAGLSHQSYNGRTLYIYVPSHMPPRGERALVVVLHGGMGNAGRILSNKSESGLNMNGVAEEDGFIVAYLNGTKVARFFSAARKGWNAGGGCCGLPAKNHVNDVAYIQGAVDKLASEYGIDKKRIFGIGHSNGAMMTQRILCETRIYAAGMAISGPLNLRTDTCPNARGARIVSLHGAEDRNVPVAGGRGTEGLSRAVYNSEALSKRIFENAGASYTLQIVPGADHRLDHIEAVIEKTEHQTIPQKAARFFGLDKT